MIDNAQTPEVLIDIDIGHVDPITTLSSSTWNGVLSDHY